MTTITGLPLAALANDLMIFYAPQELYTRRVTVMEMICASTCLTSMICFSFEAKHRREREHTNEGGNTVWLKEKAKEREVRKENEKVSR